MKDQRGKSTIVLLVAVIVALLIVLAGASYAYYSISVNGTKSHTIKTGTLTLTIDDASSSAINLTNAKPMTDTEGMATTAYTFKLKNTGTLSANYIISLVDNTVSGTRIPDNKIKINLKKDTTAGTSKLLSAQTRTLDTGTITAGTTISYELRLWIDYSAGNEVQEGQFSTKISITGNQIGS